MGQDLQHCRSGRGRRVDERSAEVGGQVDRERERVALGRPTVPDELSSHKGLMYLLRGHPTPWRFRMRDGATVTAAIASQLVAGSGEVLRRAAVAGAGLTRLFEYSLAADIASGALEVVLADHELPAVPVYAVHAQARNPALKIRAFVDFAADLFLRSPYA